MLVAVTLISSARAAPVGGRAGPACLAAGLDARPVLCHGNRILPRYHQNFGPGQVTLMTTGQLDTAGSPALDLLASSATEAVDVYTNSDASGLLADNGAIQV